MYNRAVTTMRILVEETSKFPKTMSLHNYQHYVLPSYNIEKSAGYHRRTLFSEDPVQKIRANITQKFWRV